MPCPQCAHENPAPSKFCLECGTRLSTRCPSCRHELPGGAKFCNECGYQVTSEASASRYASPESYTPRHLAERIMTSKAALEGERKLVTVLFADMKGSTELLADRDPEDARTLLDPVLEHLIEAVHRFDGTVNQVMGDGIMALFGAPIAHEDHAVRASYAALRMQESVKKYAAGVWRTHGVRIQIRVGLNSGEVVVRAIGSDLHMDYTAVGQTTHLAARMEQLAAAESIMLTPSTLALAEGFVDVKSLGPTPVKGVGAPIEVFELLGASTARSRLQAVAARGLTKFVARSAEMAQLDEALERVRAGKGQVVALVGEPGVGKSRMVWEFTHSHRTTDCLVAEAPAVSYGKATTYLPLVELLKSYFGLQSRDDARRIREKVTGKVIALDRALEPLLPALLSLLDVLPAADPWSQLDPAQRRHRTLDAVKRLLLRESEIQPLVVVFEDLHWVDGETQAVLNLLVESLPTTRTLLLVNYRPEYQHAWGSKTFYRQIRIDALPIAGAHELLDSLLGDDPGLTALKQLLLARTEGNPLFIEETVCSLIETNVLTGRRGAYQLTGAVESWTVPATVHAILAGRIDRLSPDDKRRLQAAAVVGKDVPLDLLQAITDDSEDDLRGGLARLQAAEFLYEARLFPEVEYTFKHALTHEVSYASLLGDRRRHLHGLIVEALERRNADRVGDDIELLAHHAFRGELWDKAVQYCAEAGAQAFSRSANREAVARIEQALDALGRLPETPEVLVRAIDLRFELRNAWTQTNTGFRGILDRLRQAEALALRLGDQPRLGRALDYLSNYYRNAAELNHAVALAERALAIAHSIADLGLEIAARFHLGMAYYSFGEQRAATEQLETSLSRIDVQSIGERFGLAVPPAILCRVWLTFSLAEQGRFAEAAAHANEARRLAESGRRRLDRVYALRGGVIAHARQGDLEHLLTWSRDLVDLSTEDTLGVGYPTGLAALGYAEALDGRFDQAAHHVEEALSLATAQGSHDSVPAISGWLGEILLLEGRGDEAQQRADQTLALARQTRQRGNEAWALRLLGDVATDRGSADASEYFRQAMLLATPLGLRPVIARCHAGLAKLSRQSGKQVESDEHLAAATTMFRDMDMRFWLKRVERELTS